MEIQLNKLNKATQIPASQQISHGTHPDDMHRAQQGPQGEQGLIAQLPAWQQGLHGEQGQQGKQGLQGEQGLHGDVGSHGIIGHIPLTIWFVRVLASSKLISVLVLLFWIEHALFVFLSFLTKFNFIIIYFFVG